MIPSLIAERKDEIAGKDLAEDVSEVCATMCQDGQGV